MGLFKSIKKIAGFAAPLAGLIPGIGIPAAAALGAGAGLLGGGGIKGALGGALGAGGLAGGGGALGNFLGAGSGAAGSALGSGILGAAGGALNGGAKGALLGGALGGAGGYIQGSGGLGNAYNNLTGSGTATTGALGGGASSYGGAGKAITWDSLSPDKNGISWNTPQTGTQFASVAGNSGIRSASNSNYLTPLLSAGIGSYTNQTAESQLLKGQQQAYNQLSPFLNQSFDPSQLANDAGYQFQLKEGQNALDRAAAARGNYFSGSALTDAADYSKGLTDTTLQDAYTRYSGDQSRKIGIASGLADIYGNQGNIRAGATTNLGNIFTGSLAAATGGNGVNSQGQIINPNSGYNDPNYQAYLRSIGWA